MGCPFAGVAPGTNMKSNPNAMRTLATNSIFANTALTKDGDVWWEALEKYTDKDTEMTTWLGKPWKIGEPGGPAAHANSRFTAPAKYVHLRDAFQSLPSFTLLYSPYSNT